MVDATDSQMAILADLVESLAAAEATLSSMQAARDGCWRSRVGWPSTSRSKRTTPTAAT